MESEITQTPSVDYPALLRQFFESEELTDTSSRFPSDPETWRYLSYVVARDYPEASKGKMTEELRALGHTVAQKRRKLGLTILQLARLSDIDPVAILLLEDAYLLEKTAKTLFAKIEKALGVKLDGSTKLE